MTVWPERLRDIDDPPFAHDPGSTVITFLPAISGPAQTGSREVDGPVQTTPILPPILAIEADPVSVPEPASTLLLALPLGAIIATRRRQAVGAKIR